MRRTLTCFNKARVSSQALSPLDYEPHASRSVTPGTTALEYAIRRANLAAKLPEGAIAIVQAASVKYRSGAVFYKFHQNPDFFYLTGAT